MYHSISHDSEPNFPPYYKVCTSPRRFAEHMQWLADWGYRGVTLSEGLAALNKEAETGSPLPAPGPVLRSPGEGGSQLPAPPTSPKLVALTFDDGFRDFHTAAFPILQRHGFAATMYLPTAFIGDERKSFKSRECLTWGEVRELQGAGIEFGSHTVNHPTLVNLPWPEIERELTDSKSTIEARLGRPVRSFAYPYAFPQAERGFAARFADSLRQAGYESSATTEIGPMRPGDAPLQIKRYPANSDDDKALFNAKLSGAYDWLAIFQWLAKQTKSRLPAT